MAAAVPRPLRYSEEVVHEDVHVDQELSVGSPKVRVASKLGMLLG